MQNAPFQHFVWTTKLSLQTEVKQARWVKPEVTCSLIYITTHSKQREDWCKWWTKMASNLNVFKTSKKDCILSKSNFSFAEVHWVIYRYIYIESDKKIKILTIFQFQWICSPATVLCHCKTVMWVVRLYDLAWHGTLQCARNKIFYILWCSFTGGMPSTILRTAGCLYYCRRWCVIVFNDQWFICLCHALCTSSLNCVNVVLQQIIVYRGTSKC